MLSTATTVRLALLGIDPHEIDALARISRTLQRWSELECGDGNDYASWAIERDEKTERPYMVTHSNRAPYQVTRRAVPDREAGALKRLKAIMENHPHLISYHQSDPRGCTIYILRAVDVPPTEQIDSVYTRGVAVSS
jgi:hypothetical protein